MTECCDDAEEAEEAADDEAPPERLDRRELAPPLATPDADEELLLLLLELLLELDRLAADDELEERTRFRRLRSSPSDVILLWREYEPPDRSACNTHIAVHDQTHQSSGKKDNFPKQNSNVFSRVFPTSLKSNFRISRDFSKSSSRLYHQCYRFLRNFIRLLERGIIFW